MKIIATDRAPAAIGAYSQATVHQGVVYASGQIALCPAAWAGGDVSTLVKQVLTNLAAVNKRGCSLNDVLEPIFLEDGGPRRLMPSPPKRSASTAPHQCVTARRSARSGSRASPGLEPCCW